MNCEDLQPKDISHKLQSIRRFKSYWESWNRMSDTEILVADLKDAVQKFVHERDWEKYHNPKNLAESICIEAAELLQLFQWTEPEKPEQLKSKLEKLRRIEEELADVIIYCLSMANTLSIDLSTIVLQKIEHNREKYPPGQSKAKTHIDT